MGSHFVWTISTKNAKHKKVRTKGQPFSWHFVRLAFRPTTYVYLISI